jgi:hypothetical protein
MKLSYVNAHGCRTWGKQRIKFWGLIWLQSITNTLNSVMLIITNIHTVIDHTKTNFVVSFCLRKSMRVPSSLYIGTHITWISQSPQKWKKWKGNTVWKTLLVLLGRIIISSKTIKNCRNYYLIDKPLTPGLLCFPALFLLGVQPMHLLLQPLPSNASGEQHPEAYWQPSAAPCVF